MKKNWYFITWNSYYYNEKNSDCNSEEIYSEPFYGSDEDVSNYISEKAYSNNDLSGGVGFETGEGFLVRELYLLTPQGDKEEVKFSE